MLPPQTPGLSAAAGMEVGGEKQDHEGASTIKDRKRQKTPSYQTTIKLQH